MLLLFFLLSLLPDLNPLKLDSLLFILEMLSCCLMIFYIFPIVVYVNSTVFAPFLAGHFLYAKLDKLIVFLKLNYHSITNQSDLL